MSAFVPTNLIVCVSEFELREILTCAVRVLTFPVLEQAGMLMPNPSVGARLAEEQHGGGPRVFWCMLKQEMLAIPHSFDPSFSGNG